VRAFFRGVDPTNILSAEDVASQTQVTIRITDGKNPRAALQRLIKNDREYGYVIDNDDKFHGIVSTETLRELLDDAAGEVLIKDAYIQGAVTANAADSMQDILPHVAGHAWPLPILDDNGCYLGAISKNLFLRTLHRNQTEEQGDIEAEASEAKTDEVEHG